MIWSSFETSLSAHIDGTCHQIDVDCLYDMLERELNYKQKYLDYYTRRFQGGEYQLSTAIKDTRTRIAELEMIWDAISKDEGRDSYYTMTAYPDVPLVLENRTILDYAPVYNEQVGRWEVIEKPRTAAVYCKLADFDNTGTLEPLNVSECLHQIEEEYKLLAEEKCAQLNKCITQKCKDCGKYFALSELEIAWYRGKGLVAPKRCTSCREARKNKAENTASNAEEDNLLAQV